MLTHATPLWPPPGYIIACALMRLMDASVSKAVRSFAAGRPPGIYKEGERAILILIAAWITQAPWVTLAPSRIPPTTFSFF